MSKPYFVIIGAMKSATSTLHEQLALQPGFFMSTPKEPNFFSDDQVYELGLDWYANLFYGAGPGDICGESSTHYTKLPDYPRTIERMKSYLPSLKLIYVIRHPIERLVSHYIHQWSQNVIRVNINQAIDEFDELINYSRYSMQLEPFIEAYGIENIHIIFSEAFRIRPQYELEKVAQFLGYSQQVKWHYDLPEQNVFNQRVRRFNGYDFLINHPLLEWFRHTCIPKSVREAVKNQLTLKKRPEIDDEHLQKLTLIFNNDLKSLGLLLGIELNLENYKMFAARENISLIQTDDVTGTAL